MQHPEMPQGIFQPKPNAIEMKQDATNRAARQIIDGEAAVRERKTERLKLAKLTIGCNENNQPAGAKRTRQSQACIAGHPFQKK